MRMGSSRSLGLVVDCCTRVASIGLYCGAGAPGGERKGPPQLRWSTTERGGQDRWVSGARTLDVRLMTSVLTTRRLRGRPIQTRVQLLFCMAPGPGLQLGHGQREGAARGLPANKSRFIYSGTEIRVCTYSRTAKEFEYNDWHGELRYTNVI
jgi:hypothetical protein